MTTADFHIHTTYCDGQSSPEEICLSAARKGLKKIGFSAHSYTFFDTRYCLKQENTEKYINEINRLKSEFNGKLQLLCGLETDYYSRNIPYDKLDYLIGSVHYIKVGNEYLSIDDDADILRSGANRLFGGDIYSLIEEYFRTVSDIVNKTNAQIIGHFDLISKFNEISPLFDDTHPRYVSAYRSAADSLLKHGIPFEINTGAISRGYKSYPYPALDIIDYIKEKGGKFILSSDSHHANYLAFEFDKWEKFAKEKHLSLVTL